MANGSGEALRARISLYVRDQPGVHFRELQRSLGLAPGQAMHHLRRLVEAGLLVEESGQGYVHYFVNGAPRAPRRLLATLRQPARLRIALALQTQGALTTQALADAAGCSPSTAHHHLAVLGEAGVVQRVPERPVRHALTAEGAEALAMLAPAMAAPGTMDAEDAPAWLAEAAAPLPA